MREDKERKRRFLKQVRFHISSGSLRKMGRRGGEFPPSHFLAARSQVHLHDRSTGKFVFLGSNPLPLAFPFM